MKHFLKKNLPEVLIIIAILSLASFLRFYKIDQYMTFLGDEGRDALVIQGILVNHHVPLLGPPTSVGGMYLGPLYYYMMAIPMAIFWLNPVSAAGMDALIGILTVGLIYYLGREWFGKKAAIVASLLYAVSPVTIIYSHSSWNPNPAPFFALLSILGLYQANKTKRFEWLILTGGALAFAVQMHYLALILLPVAGLLWIWQLLQIKKKPGNFWLYSGLSLAVFLFLMSPLAIFDLRHNFMNLHAIKGFFLNKGNTSFNILTILQSIWPIFSYNLVDRYISGSNFVLEGITSLLVLTPIVFLKYRWWRKKTLSWPLTALGVWLVIGVLGLAVYRQAIYDHYLGFMNPVPYLLLGSLFWIISFWQGFKKTLLEILLGMVVIILLIGNLMRTPLQNPPNRQLQRTQEVAKFIISESENKPFNFALLSANNYDSAYQFYLGLYGHKPEVVPFSITEQLFVVCEDPVCQPINNPKYEIAAFGWSKIETLQDFDGVKVYKLVHNRPQMIR